MRVQVSTRKRALKRSQAARCVKVVRKKKRYVEDARVEVRACVCARSRVRPRAA